MLVQTSFNSIKTFLMHVMTLSLPRSLGNQEVMQQQRCSQLWENNSTWDNVHLYRCTVGRCVFLSSVTFRSVCSSVVCWFDLSLRCRTSEMILENILYSLFWTVTIIMFDVSHISFVLDLPNNCLNVFSYFMEQFLLYKPVQWRMGFLWNTLLLLVS